MVERNEMDAGSDVARDTKVRAVPLPLRRPVKSQIGCKKLTIAEWNVRTLLDRNRSARPERQTAMVAKELEKYNIDVAALCETRLDYQDMTVW